MAGKSTTLTVNVVADTSSASSGINGTAMDVGKLDSAVSSASSSIAKSTDKIAGDTAKMSRDVSGSIDDVGGRAGDTSTALSALGGAIDAAGFPGLAAGAGIASTALDAAEGATILYRVATESMSLATIKDTAVKALNTAETIAATVASNVAAVATKAWTVTVLALDAAWEANPIGIVVLAIVLLVAAIVLAWNKSEGFRAVVIAGWNAIKVAAAAVWGWISDKIGAVWAVIYATGKWYIGLYVSAFEGIKTAVGAVWDWISDHAGDALALLLAPISLVEQAFDAVVEAVKRLQDWLGKIKIPSWLSSIGGAIGGLIPGRSAVAPAAARSSGTAAPSLLRAGAAPTASSATSSGGINVNVYVPESSDPVATARYLKAIMRRGEAAGVIFGTP